MGKFWFVFCCKFVVMVGDNIINFGWFGVFDIIKFIVDIKF